jgi:superfamily I DNA/RNA helicase
MRDRLAALVPDSRRMTVTTFHGLGATILREMPEAAGLTPDFRIADEAERLAVAVELAGGVERDGRKLLAGLDDEPELRARFEKSLRARDLADFDDLIRLPVRLLRDDPAATERLRARWRRISVDEYQDVDQAQYDLLALLAGDGARLTAIGDPDQAIYAFRGADVRFFLRFTDDFPGASVVTLGRNYRSSAAIVSAAAHAIAPETLVAGRELTPMRHDLEAVPVGVYGADDPDAEAAFIVGAIERLLGGSSFHALDSGRVTADGHGGIAFADIAVLYRTDAQAEMIMTALTRAGLPFQKRTHDRLAARPGVQEIAAELPHHGSGPLAARVRAAAEAVAVRHAAANTGTAPVAAAAELLKPLAGRCGDDLDRFLTELALGAEVDAYDPRAEAVALLTLHAAKGLEFPVVFIAGCERDLLPFRPVHGGREEREERETAEERRLFFVGLTRAQERLYVSYAARRTRQGLARETGPSPFLTAVPGDLTERLDTGARRRPKDRQLRLL